MNAQLHTSTTEPPFLTPKARRHRKRKPNAASPPPVVELRLVSAVKDVVGEEVFVVLTFNQAVDAAELHVAAVSLDDGTTTHSYCTGVAVTRPTAAVVRIRVVPVEPTEAVIDQLTVPEPTGIVAVNGGEMWAGVENMELPCD